MPDEASTSSTSDEAPEASTAIEPKVSREPHRIPSPPLPRWLAPAALAVAVVAAGLAIWALMSGSSSSAGAVTPMAGLEGDPKTRVCTAFNTVARAVQLQTNNNLGPDPVAQGAVAGNARLALVGGGQYLLNSLDSATPSDLADPVRSFATKLQTIGINALAGIVNTEPAQAALLADADATRLQIIELCK